MNRGLKVYKDNRKRGTVKLRGKVTEEYTDKRTDGKRNVET